MAVPPKIPHYVRDDNMGLCDLCALCGEKIIRPHAPAPTMLCCNRRTHTHTPPRMRWHITPQITMFFTTTELIKGAVKHAI
jgi:hypothetical protein